MPLEVLYLPLVPFGSRARLESTEITPLAGLRIDLTGIQPVFAGAQFADHGSLSCSRPLARLNGRRKPQVPSGLALRRKYLIAEGLLRRLSDHDEAAAHGAVASVATVGQATE